MDRLEKLMRKYERGDLDREEWLDRLVFREIEKINKQECESGKRAYIYIELMHVDFPVVFNETVRNSSPPLPIVPSIDLNCSPSFRNITHRHSSLTELPRPTSILFLIQSLLEIIPLKTNTGNSLAHIAMGRLIGI